ncbi:peptide-methionine (S)-S-oxide reductase MsrA [Hyphomicrobium sp.]|uniref:peptide-methionine (S)-S-oxide reductase MsrA n=1 Tax=Hyphomicrobium sp. TaxID=82 RepID=UPI001D416F0A|nr:peptide-methionine (S)-S-oxide reductase MsrA [Hyphomicrobium sp.]MBY0559392.1 peptide-methionine (S)-S-oxide reductase MsrA [Hyphomicrobium sp.]
MALNSTPFSKPDRWFFWLTLAAAILGVLSFLSGSRLVAEEGVPIPAPVADEHPAADAGLETTVLAGGCFWGVQGVFQHVQGVTSATSGYTGGKQADAHYNVVGTGDTGHAESVQIKFDPKTISYGKLLQIYFSVAHDPTSLNRQGPDTGTQYRSTIFPQTPEQGKIAEAYIAQLENAHVFPWKIATTVEPGRTFYAAEDYHQNFLTLNPTYPYIAINDMPKVENLKKLFPENYRAAPVLVAVAKPAN